MNVFERLKQLWERISDVGGFDEATGIYTAPSGTQSKDFYYVLGNREFQERLKELERIPVIEDKAVQQSASVQTTSSAP